MTTPRPPTCQTNPHPIPAAPPFCYRREPNRDDPKLLFSILLLLSYVIQEPKLLSYRYGESLFELVRNEDVRDNVLEHTGEFMHIA